MIEPKRATRCKASSKLSGRRPSHRKQPDLSQIVLLSEVNPRNSSSWALATTFKNFISLRTGMRTLVASTC